ncbi:TIGR02678 family protein [Atopostipes suicloacalis DSM 15692]|uniref:TIGR02678 family protein n=1 Tax=Atopostipes suicloacalis DSM 15692 TaxID=1121025 RepID=A0A1M4XHJ0_9LACT|nr:TIGR02678 family protein [Atopostipes suicloacalis]SHE92870.1 TIGR02678 family protein [Atopostipes suicloacalis DSM 15692]
MLETGFELEQQEALALLFENFWIIREQDPANYQLIRENEKALRRYISEKFGFSLIIHKDFIKLEKVPFQPRNWMGIQEFQNPRDYAIFCCGLAYLERRSVDDQFLLSEFATALEELYSGLIPLDWTNYQHRQSLVRAMKKLIEFECIHEVDSTAGGLEQFAYSEDQEVLYQATVLSRYFMRNHMRSLKECTKIEDILQMEWEENQENARQKRTYRKLMFEPVMYREDEEDLDFDYIRRYRNRVREDFETHTPFELQVSKNAAMLTLPEQSQLYQVFPDRKGITLVSLHVQAYIRQNQTNYSKNAFGEIQFTRPQFEQMIEQVKEDYHQGWSVEYREKSSLNKITEDVLNHFIEWSFAKIEEGTKLIILLPAVGRMMGEYPNDFERED